MNNLFLFHLFGLQHLFYGSDKLILNKNISQQYYLRPSWKRARQELRFKNLFDGFHSMLSQQIHRKFYKWKEKRKMQEEISKQALVKNRPEVGLA